MPCPAVLFPLQVDRSPSGNPLAWSCFERRQQTILAAVASPRFFARLSAGVSQSTPAIRFLLWIGSFLELQRSIGSDLKFQESWQHDGIPI